jgi:hypothetical protein
MPILTPVAIAIMFFMTVSMTIAVTMVVVLVVLGRSGCEGNAQRQRRTGQVKPFPGHNCSFAR